jgi:hypothetical protein
MIIITYHIYIHGREHLLIEWVKIVSELELDIKYPEITQLVQRTIDIVPSTRDFSNMLSNPAIIVKNRWVYCVTYLFCSLRMKDMIITWMIHIICRIFHSITH